MNQTIIVLDFGGQYKELIARRIREANVLAIVKSGSTPIAQLKELNPIGIILTGGPNSVYDASSPKCDKALFDIGVPILGICYGHQLINYILGGSVKPCSTSEYGVHKVNLDVNSKLLKGLDNVEGMMMSHTDQVVDIPEGFVNYGWTKDCANAVVADETRDIYAIQFHPEVEHSLHGRKLLDNFIFDICGAKGDYTMDDFLEKKLAEIRQKVGKGRVLLGLSGGVDSSVAASILSKAIPNQLVCIFVDHGLMRKNEGDEIERIFSKKKLQFIRVNAEERFLKALEGETDPERKRKIIGTEFVRVFEEESRKLGNIEYLAQGTIYPDVIESGANNTANIKSHHNVGGLPDDMSFIGIVEPLRELFKDEVRRLGKTLGLPKFLINRQPFPGPGLGVRVIGAITKEKLNVLKEADHIFTSVLGKLKNPPSQYFAVLTDTKSVGVFGDHRAYSEVIALRAVYTTDFMTGQYAQLPHKLLSKIAHRIVNEVRGVSRVVYDITGKPPATIEWE